MKKLLAHLTEHNKERAAIFKAGAQAFFGWIK